MKIELPWPPAELLKNASVHHFVKARAGKLYRANVANTAKADGWHLLKLTPPVRMRFEFYPPDRRKRDCHNMPHALAYAIDGLQDALRIDDVHFRITWPTEFCEPHKPGGKIAVEILP